MVTFKTKAMTARLSGLIAGLLLASFITTAQTFVKPLFDSKGETFIGGVTHPNYSASERRTSSGIGPKLWGAVLFSGNWDVSDPGNFPYGIYSFPAVSNLTITPECIDGYYLNANGGGVIVDGIFNYVSYQMYSGGYVYATCYRWDVHNNCYVSEAYCENPGMIAMDVTYDTTDKNIYGIYYNSDLSALEFAIADYTTATKQKISDMPLSMRCIAADGKGQLYSLDSQGKLYKLSKKDGKLDCVGDTHIVPQNALQSAVIDPRSGKLYWSTVLSDNKTAIYEVDKATAAASLLSYFPGGEQVVALSMSPVIVADGAPDYPQNVVLAFENGKTEGTLSFDIPTQNHGGSSLNGDVKYTVSVDGKKVLEGSEKAGTQVVKPISVKAGQHLFSIVLSNSLGDSDSYKIDTWIGSDILKEPKNVKLTSIGKEIRLEWDKPGGTVHGGYMSSDITYDIVRYPGGIKVADKIHGNLFEETLSAEKPTGYYYEVIPYNGEVEGLHGISNKIVTGNPCEVPYEECFDTAEAFNTFTVIDNNNDGNTWVYVDVDGYPVYIGDEKKADDWILSPEISLLDDRLYEISFDCFSPLKSVNSSYKEKIAAYIGEGLSIKDYKPVINSLTIDDSEINRYSALVSVENSGPRHIAFRAMSNARQWRLAVDNIRVTESVLKSSPAAVDGLTVVPGKEGDTSADITFVTPALNAGGTRLNGIDRIEISRNGEVVKTFSRPSLGEKVSFHDIITQTGVVKYEVIAYNESGKGLPAGAEEYIGKDLPCAPSDIIIRNVSGKIALSWNAPVKGIHGGYIDPQSLTYDLLDDSGEIVISGIRNTSATVDVDNSENQHTVRYYVRSVNSHGIGEKAFSPKVVVGNSYRLPYHESFVDGIASTLWWRQDDSSRMLVHTDDATSSDKDGYNLKFEPKVANKSSRITSGKIDLRNTLNPVLVFHHYCYDEMSATLKVEAETADGDIIKLYEMKDSDFGKQNAWIKNEVSLNNEKLKNSEYAYISLIYSPRQNVSQLLIDNINIHESIDNNITPYDISAMSTEANTMSLAHVKVLNTGRNDASDISVDYYLNDKLIESGRIDLLRSNEEKVLSFRHPLDVTMPEKINVYAIVSYAQDGNAEDNVSQNVMVDNSRSYPLPENVSTEIRDGKYCISWSSPEVPSSVGAVSDGFEDYESFTIEGFGDWKTLDEDKGYTNGIVDVHFPHNLSPYSFIVFNASKSGVKNENYYPHDGNQCLSTFGTAVDWDTWTAPRCDDWLISPVLSGNAQTISFYGKCWNDQYGPETIEVLYSLSGNSPKDFIPVGEQIEVPGKWTRYEVTLPEGARYFAIRVVSQDKFMFMLDDVTYEKASDNLVLQGFNIYLEEEIVASLHKDCLSYEYATDKESPNLYVTAVYNAGESSRELAFGTGIISDVRNENITVVGQKGSILVNGAYGKLVSVYSMCGQLVSNMISDGDIRLEAAPGIYIVKVGKDAFKIAVM